MSERLKLVQSVLAVIDSALAVVKALLELFS